MGINLYFNHVRVLLCYKPTTGIFIAYLILGANISLMQVENLIELYKIVCC